MGKSVPSRERVLQKSACIKNRQLDFINWAEVNIPEFDWNKLVRAKLDEQIEILNPEFLEDENN